MFIRCADRKLSISFRDESVMVAYVYKPDKEVIIIIVVALKCYCKRETHTDVSCDSFS